MKRQMIGRVISTKMLKTAVVEVERSYMHPRLQKVMRTSATYKVHCEDKQPEVGSLVEIREGRPVSKTKYMYLHRVVEGV